MAYATLDDIKGEMPQFRLSPNSTPTDTQAQEFLTELHAELDAVLKALGYTLPITKLLHPLSFAILKSMVQQGTIARILRSRNYGVDSPEAIGARDAQNVFRDMIKRLTDPDDPLNLPDAEGAPVFAKFGLGIAESHVAGRSLDPEAEPAFTREKVY
jgi:hypothetical protein